MKLSGGLIEKIRRGATGERVAFTAEEKKTLKELTGRTVPCLCSGGSARRRYLKEAYILAVRL